MLSLKMWVEGWKAKPLWYKPKELSFGFFDLLNRIIMISCAST